MSLEITYVQNFLVKDYNLLKLLLVVFGFGSQTFICGFSRQNICSVFVIFVHITVGCFSFWLLSHRTGRIPRIWSVLTQICYSPLRNSIASALEKTPSSQTLQVAYSYLWWQSHVWSLKFHQPWHVATSFALPWHNGGQTLYEVTLYFLV